MNNWLALSLTVLLLLGNAYFVSAEFALTGSRASRLEPLAATNKRAQKVLAAIRNLNEMLAACQLGVTICSVALGALAEPAIARLLAIPLEAIGVGPAVVHTVSFIVALLLVTALHVIIGEMVPKNVAVTHPEKSALLLVPSLLVFDKIFRPVTASLNWISLHIVSWLGMKPRHEVVSAFTAEEVASIVEVSERAGVLQDPQGLISGSLEFSERSVGETMVPLSGVVSVPAHVTPEQIERHVAETGFSRFVVRDRNHVLGYVHVKDVIAVRPQQRRLPIPMSLVRHMETLRAEDEVEDALRIMQGTGTHMALVEKNPGELGGIIFLEDVIEELVGNVRDAMQRER
ncbi:HCC family HlyC/CorC transporter [Actinobaculum suis]|uniref:HCC family HlyC/CorC transporter n=1 Tax=Actinobaculum suis TaxID=1657 RepID=A0A0K9ES58_9ACTO|nr:hemolysin family protein [Actinobaculum suis]KMY22998.1 membrane protein [Actinobaculum suis]OCA94617.1 hypothetical protein ACU20_06640 [Actinobaculum suis]OCA94929.1 hypothetical protein ACU21_05430 [Actinobaculum suis]VDG77078.1 HCC family HlyC/CorC transporter [Actinobaculum suis]